MNRRLPDWLMGYEELNAKMPTHPRFVTASGLSIIAAALQRKVMIPRGDLITFPNLFTVLVGPASIGKGVSISEGAQMLADIGIELGAASTTKRGLIKIFENNPAMVEIDGKEYYHTSITILATELTVFLGRDNKELLSTLTDIYDSGGASGGSWKDSTGMYGVVELEHLWINLWGGIPPETLQRLLQTGAIEDGLASRILFIYGDRKRKADAFPKHPKSELREKLKSDLNEIYKLSGMMKMTQEYIDLYEPWHDENIEPENYPIKDRRFAPYCDRRVGLHLPKLATILCASRGDDMTLRAEDFHRALEILIDFETDMPKALGGAGSLGIIGSVMFEVEQLLSVYKAIRYKDLLTQFRLTVTDTQLWSIVISLEKMGDIKVLPVIKGNRDPSKNLVYYRLHPEEVSDWEIQWLK